jgi:ferredoxin-NADP reductase
MGINPLMSMISSLAEKPDVSFEVEVLYSLKDPGGDREADGMLFVDRIATIFAREKLRGSLKLFLTGKEAVGGSDSSYVTCNEVEVPFKSRRIEEQDLSEAVGKDLETAVVYTCGPPDMTDGFIELLTSEAGWAIDSTRVLFEKWW